MASAISLAARPIPHAAGRLVEGARSPEARALPRNGDIARSSCSDARRKE
eukprot:CAMPEP_0182892402 /NCGR_PEP_ID=MMETSP0034_2-20130328/23851_1 /TAXON_ID=156128 /ORGANISM="Nephroselmis pyriformis, Strain CCMP717" /LENGTH=49 /DNA_ID=CAMNT_0025026079 /DNA_START=37 /DNA_END=186 /DNA_ORIENTATION=+